MGKHLLLSVIAMTCAMTTSAQTVQNIAGSITKGRTLLPSKAFDRAPARVTAEQLLGCSEGTVFGGEYQEFDGVMTGTASSDEGRKDAATSLYQHFSGCYYKFNAVRFIGLFNYYSPDNGWVYCTDRGGIDENGQMTKPIKVRVAFYEDGEDGKPGKQVFNKIVDVVGEKTGIKRGTEEQGFSEMYFFRVDLGEELKMDHGFMQISAVDTGDESIGCYLSLFTTNSSPEYSLMKIDKRDGNEPTWNQTLSCCYCFYGSGELIAQKAMKINRFLSPTVSDAGKYSKVQVEVQNIGQQDIKDITLQLWLDGKLLATEKLGASIGSMESYKYTFQTRVDCSEAGEHKITVKNATPGCEALGNDELSIDIVIGDGTVSYPESMSASSYYYIKNVKVGDIDNTSEASTYSDFTDMKTSIQPGGTLTLSVTPNNKFVTLGAWIDWNGNGSFNDVGEALELRDGTGEVKIPTGSNVKLGDKRLRIVASFDTPLPTGTYDFGETEDYTITVVNSENLPAINLSAEMIEAATSGDKKAIPLNIANNGGETLTGELKYDYILPNAPTSSYTICKTNVPAEVKSKLLRRAAVMGVANPDASEGTEYVLKYDKGQNGLTGISNSTSAIYANYYPGNMLSALSGMEITSVDVYIGTPATDNSIVIYGEGTQSKNGNLIAEKEFNVDKNSWNHIVLDKPVKIGDTDLWIGYKTSGLTGSQYCIGIDKGSAIVGFGDMVNIDGETWWSMSDLGMDFNYCIRANVSGKRTPAINWLSLDKKQFEVAPGSSTTLNVNVDASGLDKALYEAKIEVVSNDGLSSAIDIPVYIVNDATTGIYAKAYTGDTTIKLGNRQLSVSAEKNIYSVQVSDLAGQSLSNTTVKDSECSIPLGNAVGSINIVTIRYADGSQTTIKVPTIR